jgi:hypothetical protein
MRRSAVQKAASLIRYREIAMGMGKRKPVQETLFIAHSDLPRSAGHPFYVKLNQLLDEAGFDSWRAY